MFGLWVHLAVVCLAIFGARAYAQMTFDAKVPENLRIQMYQDLKFVYSIQGKRTTPLHQEIYGPLDGSVYKDWFEKRVELVSMDECGGGNAVACVRVAFPGVIFMTSRYAQFSHPQIARISVLFHEARHNERENYHWLHAYCPVPFKNDQDEDVRSIWTGAPLAGQDACDYTEYGSYGVQTIMLRNIAQNCTSCTEKQKVDAELYAQDHLIRITSPRAKARLKKDFRIR